MLSALLGDNGELALLKRVIIEKTEGNPFFMEETVQVLLDEGVLVRNGVTRLMQPMSEIYNWFTEGFDTADLKDAKALLEEL